MKPGIYDIDINEYHASEGISRSGISLLKKDPLDYWDKYINPDKPHDEPSKSLVLGDLVHTLVLEPEQFSSRYIFAPDINKRTNAGKKEYQEFLGQAFGKKVITEEDDHIARKIRDAVEKHPVAPQFTKNAQIEKSIYWHDKDTGVLCKARPDIWIDKVIVDLKTTDDPTRREFERSIYKYNYHIQAAMCLDAAASTGKEYHSNFVFIAVQNKRPFKVRIYPLDDEAIDKGREEYKQQLKVYAECKAKNQWDTYEIEDISLPRYAFL